MSRLPHSVSVFTVKASAMSNMQGLPTLETRMTAKDGIVAQGSV